MTLAKILILFSLIVFNIQSRDFIIYSVEHDLPMGHENEMLRKNYYLNIGTQQGISKGTTLDVYRAISQNDPFETKKRYNYNIKNLIWYELIPLFNNFEACDQNDTLEIIASKYLN